MTQPFNADRLYQAIHLRDRLFADGLGQPEYLVLLALARRMATETIPGTSTVKDSCFPSLDEITADTPYSEPIVRRSLDRLVEKGWLGRTRAKNPR